jgi:hypothetical protein
MFKAVHGSIGGAAAQQPPLQTTAATVDVQQLKSKTPCLAAVL